MAEVLLRNGLYYDLLLIRINSQEQNDKRVQKTKHLHFPCNTVALGGSTTLQSVSFNKPCKHNRLMIYLGSSASGILCGL